MALDPDGLKIEITLNGADRAYALLDLEPGCGSREVGRAYLRLAKVTHPDWGGNDVDMAALSAAYERLQELER